VISLTQMAINTRIYSSTGYTPVELTSGTTARQYFKNPADIARQDGDALADFNEALRNVHDAAKLNILIRAHGGNDPQERRLRMGREELSTINEDVPREPRGRRKYSPPPGTYTTLLIPIRIHPRAPYRIKQFYWQLVLQTACLLKRT